MSARARRARSTSSTGPKRRGRAVGEHDVQLVDVVDRGAVDDRVAAGGVVADHPAERGPVGGRGVGAEAEAVAGDGAVEVLLHDAGPDAHPPRGEVDLADRVHVPRGVEHQPLAGGLPGQARARAARDDRHVEARGGRDRGSDVGGVAREGDEQWRARVQARVAREQVARVAVGPHLAAQLSSSSAASSAARASLRVSSRKRMLDPYPARAMTHRSGRHFLQIPGPTNVPDRVLRAIDAPTIDHRGPDFARLGLEVLEGLRGVFKTSGPVVVYPASGTGAWEAALVNTLSPGDRVLAFETGHFATLWRAMAERLGLEVQWVEGDWRHGADPERAAEILAPPTRDIRAVMVVHNETSTGVTSRIPDIRAAIDSTGHDAAAARRRHLLAGLDRLPARGMGRRRHRRRLPEGPHAARRTQLQRGQPEGARRLRARAHAALLLGLEADHRGQRDRLLALHVGDEPALRPARGADDAAARGGSLDRLRPPPAPRRRHARRGRGVGPRGARPRPARAVGGPDRRRAAGRLRRRRGPRA